MVPEASRTPRSFWCFAHCSETHLSTFSPKLRKFDVFVSTSSAGTFVELDDFLFNFLLALATLLLNR